MPGVYRRRIAQRKQHLGDGVHQRRVVAAWQVGATDRSCEKGVADEQSVTAISFSADLQADAARAVAGRVVNGNLVVPEVDRRQVVEHVGGRLWPYLEPEHLPLLHDLVVEEQVVAMQIDRRVERRLGR